MKKKAKRRKILFLVFLIVAGVIFFKLLETSTYKEPDHRIVVFVLDAGDWRPISKLLNEGKLPNIKYLMDLHLMKYLK